MQKFILVTTVCLSSLILPGCLSQSFQPMEQVDRFIDDGNGAVVPINATGEQLYAQHCAACHFSPPDNNAQGASVDIIKAALLVVGEMKLPSLQALRDSEIAQISDFLGGSSTPVGGGGGGTPNIPTPSQYDPPSAAPLQRADAFGETGMQRLTLRQYVASIEQNLGITVKSALKSDIPLDSNSNTHFENDYQSLSVTFQMTKQYGNFAEKMAKEYKQSNFTSVAGCTPSSATDKVCFEKFVQKMGRRFLRRPLTSREVTLYSDTLLDYASEESRFMAAVEMALEAWMQHPEFLYRIEEGTTQSAPSGLTKLNNYEVATRLAFLITGRGPDDQLLDAAASGGLSTANGRANQVNRLLRTTNAKEHWVNFHGQWLGYGNTSLDANLGPDMLLESQKLIEKIVFEDNADWLDIFRANKTYLTPKLATHYGISGVQQAKWVDTVQPRGGGILSHGSFAATGMKFGDTSPTLRGYEIYKRVMCGKFTESIPSTVDVTVAPGNPSDCKPQRYSMRSLSACTSCHTVTDGIGFGLESIGPLGQIRTREPSHSNCQIAGDGDYKNQNFNGPSALGLLLAADPEVGACATEHIFEYMLGRNASSADQATLDALEGEYYQTRNLQGILLNIAKSEAMLYKRSR